MAAPDRIRILEANLDRQVQWIAAAEGRAPLTLALISAILGTAASRTPTTATQWSVLAAISASALLLTALAVLGCLAAASFPRTKANRESILYFGSIANRTAVAYAAETQSLDEATYLDDLAGQCHRNAEIATTKFRWIRRAQAATMISIIPWILTLISLRVGS